MKIIVVGAGLAGLAAATWAKRAGHDVVVYEATSRAGGRAKTIVHPENGDRADVGTQYFHSNYKRALSLINDAGLRPELRKISGRTRFFDQPVKGGTFTTGHRVPYIHAGTPVQNLKLIISGLARMALNWQDPYAVSPNSKADMMAASDAVPDPFEWAYNARTLIAAGALIEPEPGTISYHHLIRLMRIIVITDYLTLDRGIASLHTRLADALNINFDAPVSGIKVAQDRVAGIRLETGEEIGADHVIIATEAPATHRLLPESWQNERQFLRAIKQPPAQTVTLFLDKPLEAKVWSYVFPENRKKLVSFCVDASRKNSKMAPSGNAVLQAWICHPASEHLQDFPDEDIQKSVVAELSNHFPNLKDHITYAHVHRVSNAIPQMTIGHNKRAQTFLIGIDQRRGISLCGDYLSGGYMECALWSVERALNHIKRIDGK